jgi:hypothetical protein
LLILEGIGSDVSRGIHETKPVGKNIGFVPPPLFERMLGAELSLLHRRGGGLELLMVEMDPTVLQAKLALELRRNDSRLAICHRESGTLMLYKRDSKGVAARSAVSAAMRTLIATGTVRAMGWVSVLDEGMGALSADVVLRLATSALEQSLSTSDGRIQHTSITGKPTSEAGATASPPSGER